MLLYTYATPRPVGARARSYTWARPPTCTPCRPLDHQLMRAPVDILQTPFLSFRYVPVATSHSTTRHCSGRFPNCARCGDRNLRADAQASWLVHELAVYNAAASSDSESVSSDSPHANQTNPPILSQCPLVNSETSFSSSDDIPLQHLFARPPMDGHDKISAERAYGQPLRPSRAPAATPAGPAFQPRRLLRSELRPAAEAVGHACAPADPAAPVGPPPPGIQATRSSPLLVAGAASRTVEADQGPPVELPPPPMSPLPDAGTAAPRADSEAPYAAPSNFAALPPAGRGATSSLGRVFTARSILAWLRSGVSSVRSIWPGSSMDHRHRSRRRAAGRKPSGTVDEYVRRNLLDAARFVAVVARDQDPVRSRCGGAGKSRECVEVAVAARSVSDACRIRQRPAVRPVRG